MEILWSNIAIPRHMRLRLHGVFSCSAADLFPSCVLWRSLQIDGNIHMWQHFQTSCTANTSASSSCAKTWQQIAACFLTKYRIRLMYSHTTCILRTFSWCMTVFEISVKNWRNRVWKHVYSITKFWHSFFCSAVKC